MRGAGTVEISHAGRGGLLLARQGAKREMLPPSQGLLGVKRCPCGPRHHRDHDFLQPPGR
jgi:hypothetical protein